MALQVPRLFLDTAPIIDSDETASTTELVSSTSTSRRRHRTRIASAFQHITRRLTPQQDSSSYTQIPDGGSWPPAQPDSRPNPFLRCLATIKARHEANLTRSWRQQTSNQWHADGASYNWYLAAMYA